MKNFTVIWSLSCQSRSNDVTLYIEHQDDCDFVLINGVGLESCLLANLAVVLSIAADAFSLTGRLVSVACAFLRSSS